MPVAAPERTRGACRTPAAGERPPSLPRVEGRYRWQVQPRFFVVLAVPSTDVLTTYSLRLVDYHYTQAANAVVLIIAAIAYFGTLLGQKLTKTNLAQGLGG